MFFFGGLYHLDSFTINTMVKLWLVRHTMVKLMVNMVLLLVTMFY